MWGKPLNRETLLFKIRRQFTSTVVPKTESLKIDIRFDELKHLNVDKLNVLSRNLTKILSKSQLFIQRVNLLECSLLDQNSEVCKEIVKAVFESKNDMDVQGLLVLCSFLETSDYFNRTKINKVKLEEEEKLLLETIVLENLDRMAQNTSDFFDNFSLGRLASDQPSFLVDVSQINDLLSKKDKQSIERLDFDSCFSQLMSILKFYSAQSLETQNEVRNNVKSVFIYSLPLLRPNALLKVLSFVDLENTLFDDELKFALEKRLADLSKNKLGSLLPYVLRVLSDNPRVFRQKLIMAINADLNVIPNRLTLINLIDWAFLNWANAVSQDQLTKALNDSLSKPFSLDSNSDFDSFVKLQTLFLEGVVENHFAEKIDSFWKDVDSSKLTDAQLIKAFMLCYHSKDEHSLTVFRDAICERKTVDLSTAGNVIFELIFMLENEKINKESIKAHFSFLIDLFLNQLKHSKEVEKSEKLMWRDLVCELSDDFDDALEHLCT